MSKRRHVSITHHQDDGEHVRTLAKPLGRNGFEIRNSSIQAFEPGEIFPGVRMHATGTIYGSLGE